MTQIDTSMYNTARPASSNPLEMLSTAANLRNTLTQGQLAQGMLQGQQAVAGAMAGAGGNPMDTANALMNIGGQAGIYGPQAVEAGLAMKKQLLGLSQDQLELGKNVQATIASSTLPLIMDIMKAKKDGTYDPQAAMKQAAGAGAHVVASSKDASGEYTVTPQHIMNALQGINFQDPDQAVNGLVNSYTAALAAQGHIDQALALKAGTPVMINTGAVQQPGMRNPLTGDVSVVGTGIANTMTPAERAQPTTVIGTDAQGNPVKGQIPLGSIRTPTGGAVNAMPTTQVGGRAAPPMSPTADEISAAMGSPTVNESDLSNGIVLPGKAPPITGIPRSATASQAATNPAGFTQTEFAPGYTEAKTGAASANVHNAQELMSYYNTVPQQKALLNQMESHLGDFTSGPAASAWKELGAGISEAFDIPLKSIASQEEFNKASSMIAQQQFKALGGTGTNDQLASAMSTSPNQYLSKLGNQGILHMLQGNADAMKVMGDAWIDATKPAAQGGGGLTAADYPTFVKDFQKHFDPMVFQLPYMKPADRTSLLNGMNKKEQARLIDNVNYAGKQGWIPDARSSNGR